MKNLLDQLNAFDPDIRKQALATLCDKKENYKPPCENVNLHIHSFFSYNAYNRSPSQIAYFCRREGLYAGGIIDFDVLDGLHEFYNAGDMLGLRTTVGLETRAFFSPLADKEIDSPGEPGVSYIAGTGFTSIPEKGSEQERFLQKLANTAKQRNKQLIARVNSQLQDIAIDYQTDVLPLTPAGNATERHIVIAYINKSKAICTTTNSYNDFWASVLKTTPAKVAIWNNNLAEFQNKVRARLAKRGGIGYVQPASETFPEVADVFAWIRSSGAIPTESWLDGTSDGEKSPEKLLALSIEQGAIALNIIPDRNWNIKNTEEKQRKTENLQKIVQTATKYDMPLHIGTEMNKPKQPLYDNLDGEILKLYKPHILRGARIITGHCILQRFSGIGYTSEYMEDEYANRTSKKNHIFEAIGALPYPSLQIISDLQQLDKQKAYDRIMESARQKKWIV